jgi:ribosomal protein L24|tara:strand:+ start:763 stop:1032 length:270 start_codon:yes stop_codon:yes gene_type:complete
VIINQIVEKKDQVYIQKITLVEVKTVKIMLKPIRDKEDSMHLSTLSLFNHMTDDDFLAVHNAGQLKNLCLALSLDMQSLKDKKVKTYEA